MDVSSAGEMQMSDSGCPDCGSPRVMSTGRNASGSWKCMSCSLAFEDFGAAPTVTAYAVKQDEGFMVAPRMDKAEEWARYYSAPGRG